MGKSLSTDGRTVISGGAPAVGKMADVSALILPDSLVARMIYVRPDTPTPTNPPVNAADEHAGATDRAADAGAADALASQAEAHAHTTANARRFCPTMRSNRRGPGMTRRSRWSSSSIDGGGPGGTCSRPARARPQHTLRLGPRHSSEILAVRRRSVDRTYARPRGQGMVMQHEQPIVWDEGLRS